MRRTRKSVTEADRNRYMTDGRFQTVREVTHPTVRDVMDLALLSSQRPSDVLKITRYDILDRALWIIQNKTKAQRATEIIRELKVVE